jgi:HSP20 family protein
MPNVHIEKVPEGGNAFRALVQQADSIYENIRNRAFELFKRRGDVPGFELDDCFKAEQDFLFSPEAEMVEKDGNFRLKVAVAGFDEKDLTVTALPGVLFVTANAEHEPSEKDGAVYFCEFTGKQLYRRFNFPAAIDVDQVEAKLEKGMLTITAPRMDKALSAPKTVAIQVAA